MITVRRYGEGGPLLVLVHGGPGAPGYMAPVARRLASRFTVMEPLQRCSGDVPLSVALHVADMEEVLRAEEPGRPLALIGASWGAMLALAWAAERPDRGIPLVLVGCGTFDRAARAVLQQALARRTGPDLADLLSAVAREQPDPDRQLQAMAEMTLPLYSVDPIDTELEVVRFDGRGHQETWRDMLRVQHEGRFPAAFAAIRAPVLMIHGACDPHPGALVRDSLAPHLPQIEYRELPRCGHYPWMERHAREEFYGVLLEWLGRRSEEQSA